MFCTRCGIELHGENDKFCAQCGQPTSLADIPFLAGPGSKRLTRSVKNKKIGGVLAGFAQYFGLDATPLRLLAAGTIVMTGLIPGIVAYLVCWMVMPLEPAPAPATPAPAHFRPAEPQPM